MLVQLKLSITKNTKESAYLCRQDTHKKNTLTHPHGVPNTSAGYFSKSFNLHINWNYMLTVHFFLPNIGKIEIWKKNPNKNRTKWGISLSYIPLERFRIYLDACTWNKTMYLVNQSTDVTGVVCCSQQWHAQSFLVLFACVIWINTEYNCDKYWIQLWYSARQAFYITSSFTHT